MNALTIYIYNPYEYTVLIKFLEPILSHFRHIESEDYSNYFEPIFMYSEEYNKDKKEL